MAAVMEAAGLEAAMAAVAMEEAPAAARAIHPSAAVEYSSWAERLARRPGSAVAAAVVSLAAASATAGRTPRSACAPSVVESSEALPSLGGTHGTGGLLCGNPQGGNVTCRMQWG